MSRSLIPDPGPLYRKPIHMRQELLVLARVDDFVFGGSLLADRTELRLDLEDVTPQVVKRRES